MNDERPSPMTPAGPTGLLVIDKPLRRTSMDICRIVRRRLVNGGAPKRVKVGHGGTLDPLATGVLVVLVGKATRMCDAVMAGAKAYAAEVDLSAFTATDDAEGPRQEVEVAHPPALEQVSAACASFEGVIQQRPPAYSAIKVEGQRAYDLARGGDLRELPARPVTIYAVRVTAYAWPRLAIEVECGKGTYIRSLARDIGVALGTGGYLTALRRTRVGRFGIEMARAVESLPERMGAADLLAPGAWSDEEMGRPGGAGGPTGA